MGQTQGGVARQRALGYGGMEAQDRAGGEVGTAGALSWPWVEVDQERLLGGGGGGVGPEG